MWYTTRHEGFDDPRHTKRSPQGAGSLLGLASAAPLRVGVFLELVALTGFLLTYYVFEGQTIFTYDLQFTTAEMRENHNFRALLALFAGLQLLGALYIMLFQVFLADDACWARGYRAGSKLLSSGAFFDVLSCLFQFVVFAFMLNNYNAAWWAHFKQGGVEWTFLAFARLSHAVAMVLYAQGLCLLELYHDEGTNDWHAIINNFLFTAAGVAELVIVFMPDASAGIVILWIALVSALLWALPFEQEVHDSSPQLHETELTNDIEQQVEKFARLSPYAAAPQAEGGFQ